MGRKNRKQEPSAAPEEGFHPFAALSQLEGAKSATPQLTAIASELADTKIEVPVLPRLSPGSWPKIVLRREKSGRGGKTVTRVQGIPAGEQGLLLASLKRELGCGGLIAEGELLLLGSLVGRAAERLRALGAKQVIEGN